MKPELHMADLTHWLRKLAKGTHAERGGIIPEYFTGAADHIDALVKDKARLDKLEAYLADGTRNLSQPNPPDDLTWQFGYNGGRAYVIDGGGNTLREAIDSLPA